MGNSVWLLCLVFTGGIMLGTMLGMYVEHRKASKEINQLRRMFENCRRKNGKRIESQEVGVPLIKTRGYVGPDRRTKKDRRMMKSVSDISKEMEKGRLIERRVVLPRKVDEL